MNWMPGLNMTIGVIGVVVQQEIGGVSVKDGDNFTFDVPATEVTAEQIHVSEEKGHITVEHQVANIKHDITGTVATVRAPLQVP